nr:integrase, catalytic region, zinc finger, CCHC-type, peptidase aspartic, catalytic [Tanacetum cinerariifolium]
MVGGNGRNQFRLVGNQTRLIVVLGVANQNGNGNVVAARVEGNGNGNNRNPVRFYNCRGMGHLARNCTVRPRRRDAAYLQTQLLIAQKEEAVIQLQAKEFDLIASIGDLDEIKKVNANCILMANLQQAPTSITQTDKAPVYDSNGSAEKQQSLYNGKVLLEKHDPPAVYDSEETLQLAQERVDNTAKTRRPQPRINRKNDRVPYASKDEAPEEIKTFLKKITVLLHALNDTKLKNQVLKEYFDSVGISHQSSFVRSPQQNVVVERRHQTLVEAARTMLIFSFAMLLLWAEAIATVCYTQNRSIIHRRFDKMPYELINGRKPDIYFLHVFEALCYPKNDREDIGKLGGKVCMFDGSTYCEDDDPAKLVDGGANSSSTSYEVFRLFTSCKDEFLGVGVLSVIVVDVVRV